MVAIGQGLISKVVWSLFEGLEDMGFSPSELVALGSSLECVTSEFVYFIEDLMDESDIFMRYEPILTGSTQVGDNGPIRCDDSGVGVDDVRWGSRYIKDILAFGEGLYPSPTVVERSPPPRVLSHWLMVDRLGTSQTYYYPVAGASVGLNNILIKDQNTMVDKYVGLVDEDPVNVNLGFVGSTIGDSSWEGEVMGHELLGRNKRYKK